MARNHTKKVSAFGWKRPVGGAAFIGSFFWEGLAERVIPKTVWDYLSVITVPDMIANFTGIATLSGPHLVTWAIMFGGLLLVFWQPTVSTTPLKRGIRICLLLIVTYVASGWANAIQIVPVALKSAPAPSSAQGVPPAYWNCTPPPGTKFVECDNSNVENGTITCANDDATCLYQQNNRGLKNKTLKDLQKH